MFYCQTKIINKLKFSLFPFSCSSNNITLWNVYTILRVWNKTWSFNIGKINNGWYLILENITRGYGNHKCNIEFITSGEVSLLKIFKSSCKSLLASKLTLSEHFPKISKVTLLKVTKIVSLSKVLLLKKFWFLFIGITGLAKVLFISECLV